MIEERRSELEACCRRFKVKRLDLFGSAVRGGFRTDSSDLDFLVAIEAPSSGEYADNFLGLASALEELFHRHVDLVTERSIRNPYFRETVEATRETVYEG